MIVPDVNVLVYAVRPDTTGTPAYADWLQEVLGGQEPVGISELVLSGVVRVITNSRVFAEPSPVDAAVAWADALLAQPAVVRLRPGPRHWSLFADLARSVGARGNLVADAYHAALAIEHGAVLLTTDRDFARFRGLRWRHPLR